MKVKKGWFCELESVLCSCSDVDKGGGGGGVGCCLGSSKPKAYDCQSKPSMVEVSCMQMCWFSPSQRLKYFLYCVPRSLFWYSPPPPPPPSSAGWVLFCAVCLD